MLQREDALAEALPALSKQEALVEANRCLYCYDAPCTHACPTHIDIPGFIKKIATENTLGSARTILSANLLGATCARVCPVQELCEGACVLGAEHKPIMIGRLQRYAMDYVYRRDSFPLASAPATGKKVAVVGAGPAGLSCAGELALLGHAVTLFEKRNFAGGLSAYGIIALREPWEIALTEAAMIERLGVTMRTGVELDSTAAASGLRNDYDAIFIGGGLESSMPELGIPGEEHIVDGLKYVEQSKMDLANLRIGRSVVVIGAGNTAIDCATIARRLGAERVTIAYRRTEREMTAYPHEYEFARNEGIEFRFLAQPIQVLSDSSGVTGLECVVMSLGERDESGRPSPRPRWDSKFVLRADQVVKAIGQLKHSVAQIFGVKTERGYIQVDDKMKTSSPGVFAGGDCIRAAGSATTVMAVQDGKIAARSIHTALASAATAGRVA
ncbi:MAG TPA: NAD(P)-dependent oxidoreductase [Bryobacteraceae bacterium]|nr:NAD(P)-dependent oxidoreductase [Bryobacteraceae bacterium]